MIQVKICGVTNEEDARWAANLGADFVGLNFAAESPRRVSPEKAAQIAGTLPPFVRSVGVFVNPEIPALARVLKSAKLSALQLHGDEPPDLVREIKTTFALPVWKAVRVRSAESLGVLPALKGIADVILLDCFKEGQYGGTGGAFDWDLALKAKESGIPVFMAGGLTPENVAEAVKKVSPAGVDAASGVEKEGHPKKKDVEKMKQFISKAKAR